VALRFFLTLSLGLATGALRTAAQDENRWGGGVKRVTVSQNNDGSRTTYEVDGEARKTVATTTGSDGKLQSKIRYDLDEAGRFARGEVYGPDDQLRFKTAYKYDSGGQLLEETQLAKDGSLKNKLVYSYDQLSGRQTGYAVYDAAGKLVGQTRTNASAAAPPAPRSTPTQKKPQ
jgi:YD repeat-containing protein